MLLCTRGSRGGGRRRPRGGVGRGPRGAARERTQGRRRERTQGHRAGADPGAASGEDPGALAGADPGAAGGDLDADPGSLLVLRWGRRGGVETRHWKEKRTLGKKETKRYVCKEWQCG
jgi:hypothetical protein